MNESAQIYSAREVVKPWDSELVHAEVSTAHPGWRTDVVRLDDRYGRSGTSAP